MVLGLGMGISLGKKPCQRDISGKNLLQRAFDSDFLNTVFLKD